MRDSSDESNPYQAGTAAIEHTAKEPRSVAFYAVGMILIPILVAILTIFAGGLPKKVWPDIDERYISLLLGVPWTIASLCWGAVCWCRGHRALGVAGVVFWTGCGLFGAWVTIAFWNG